jgi:glycerol-3-phosphate O-acyltransferase
VIEPWPAPADEPVVLLTERLSPTERTVFDAWLAANRPAGSRPTVIDIPQGGRLDDATTAHLVAALSREDDPLFVPVSVLWSGDESAGTASAARALLLGDPRRPWGYAQRWLAHKGGEPAQVIVGRSAHVSEIRRRYLGNVDPADDRRDRQRFALYVSRAATLALEQKRTRLLGPSYKIPRLVRQEMLDSARFSEAVRRVAAKTGRPLAEVMAEAETDLGELVTGWGRVLADLKAQMGQKVYRLGYDEHIEYDSEQVEKVREALQRHPGVLLMSHRSHLDGVMLPVALADNGLPRTQLLAGINMAFFPFGALMRRAGVIFIRREFKDDPVYKAVLREYIGFLVEKRFHLQWSIEGTRSRTGKMEPPRLGLLSYVVAAMQEGRASDVLLVPVSIAYDQLHEVGEFASYARGGSKKAEGLGFVVGWLRGQRRGYGKIYINFADPISVRKELGDSDGERDPNALPKLAIEVAWRMNQVTPLTGAALLTTVLLGTQGRALTLGQIRAAVTLVVEHAQRRGLPFAASARRLDTDEGVLAVLEALAKHDVVSSCDTGFEPVWTVEADHFHAASFYRNSLVHFFVDGAVCELALAHVALEQPADPVQAFWTEAYALRDLLKFDFFFPDKDEFRARLDLELARQVPDWQQWLAEGREDDVLAGLEVHAASVMFASFFEAYGVVADVLEAARAEPIDAAELRKRSMGVGQQYLLQSRVHSSESVSSLLFRTGVQVADNRGLLAGGEDAAIGRVTLAWQIRDALRRIEHLRLISERRLDEIVGTA